MEFAQRPRAGLTKPGWPMRLTHERPAAVSACPPVCLSSCPLVCLSACPPVLLPASGAPNETAEQGDRQVPGCRSGGRVAGWPGGRVTGWPGGRVAGWPGGRVAGWPGGWVLFHITLRRVVSMRQHTISSLYSRRMAQAVRTAAMPLGEG